MAAVRAAESRSVSTVGASESQARAGAALSAFEPGPATTTAFCRAVSDWPVTLDRRVGHARRGLPQVRALGVDGADERRVRGRAQRAGDVHAAEQCVLQGQLLVRLGEVHRGLRGRRRARDRGDDGLRVEGVGDGRGVRVVRARRRTASGRGSRCGSRSARPSPSSVAREPRGQLRVQIGGRRGGLVDSEAQRRLGGSRRRYPSIEVVGAAPVTARYASASERSCCKAVTLHVELHGDGGVDRPQLGLVVRGADRVDRRDAPQRGQRDDGQRQQADDPGADRARGEAEAASRRAARAGGGGSTGRRCAARRERRGSAGVSVSEAAV